MKSIFIAFFILFTSISSSVLAETGSSVGAQGLEAVNPNAIEASGSDRSALSDSLCQIILILNGRVGRALAAIAIFGLGIAFFLGKITWTLITTMGIGMGVLFGAKTVTLMLLPYSVKTVNPDTGTQEDVSPEELIRKACPELK